MRFVFGTPDPAGHRFSSMTLISASMARRIFLRLIARPVSASRAAHPEPNQPALACTETGA